MTRRLVLANYHSVEEEASVALYHSLGFEVVSLGAYLVPREPGDNKRPPLDIDPPPPEVLEACRDTHAAKGHYPDVLLDWAGPDGILVSHHFITETIFLQWPRLKQWGGRVIWRTDGQSSPDLERTASYYRSQGLERVSYSKNESALAHYAGHDAIIRMGFDTDEFSGWTGISPTVINISQHLAQRGSATNYGFWEASTRGLPRSAMGPGSEEIAGTGELTYDEMKKALRRARAYCYTGTQPASYTMGLIEAGLTGVPIVSIGPAHMNQPELFEAPELIPLGGYDDPDAAKAVLRKLLNDYDFAAQISKQQRAMLAAEFGIEKVAADWKAYLDG